MTHCEIPRSLHLVVMINSFIILPLFISDCPDGWVVKQEFGKCYFYLNDDVYNWTEANARCAALDPETVATLTSVRSQEENSFVFSLINYGSWVGGTDEAEEGVWR